MNGYSLEKIRGRISSICSKRYKLVSSADEYIYSTMAMALNYGPYKWNLPVQTGKNELYKGKKKRKRKVIDVIMEIIRMGLNARCERGEGREGQGRGPAKR
jgi:hypothetical protein